MGKMGKMSSSDIKKLKKKLEKLNDNADEFLLVCAKEIAARIYRGVVLRTPVGDYTKKVKIVAARSSKKHMKGDVYEKRVNIANGKIGGTLRRGWFVGPAIKDGDVYKIEISNPVEYASYVEYGHRQTPGRYVPALGCKLKKNWVKGRYMMTYAVQDVEDITPQLIEKRYTNI